MSQGLVVLEAEPCGDPPAGATAAIEACTRELTLARSVGELADSAVRAVANITGYSRVMLYRFAADGSGTVIAERLADERPSYLGLRYPASDIPAQARLLYLRNLTRVIVDAADEGLPLVRSGDPLDLSLSVLRSVSPVHLAYMRNMGTAASMSISLVVDGRLWGLIACHHHEPMCPPLSGRSLAELMGRLYSLAFARAERQGLDLDIKTLLLSPPGVEPLVDLTSAPTLFAGACEVIDRLFDISGVVLHIDGRLRTWGAVPDAGGALAAAQATEPRRSVVPVESLATIAPQFARLAPETAGMLALPLGAQGRDWLLLLRDEVHRHVKWAGDPRRTVTSLDGRLSPRRSFAVWEEIVRGHCEPWTRVEIELAEVLRIRLLEVLLAHREQRELEAARVAAQQQSLLVRELNHRVRNMLGLIKGLVHQTAAGCGTVEDLTARLDDRVHALSRAYTQIERANWRPTALKTLVTEETRAFAEPGQVSTPRRADQPGVERLPVLRARDPRADDQCPQVRRAVRAAGTAGGQLVHRPRRPPGNRLARERWADGGAAAAFGLRHAGHRPGAGAPAARRSLARLPPGRPACPSRRAARVRRRRPRRPCRRHPSRRPSTARACHAGCWCWKTTS